jgi:hypothetical protein
MKRTAALLGALLLTLALAAPAVAAKAVTATVATALCPGYPGSDFREWGNEQTWHWRDAGSENEMLLLDVGTDTWLPNGDRIHYAEGVNLVPNKEGYTAHGKMEVRGSRFGDFAGSWSSTPSTVEVTLHGLDGALYGHLRISIVGVSGEFSDLPALPTTACGGDYPPEWYEISTWKLH